MTLATAVGAVAFRMVLHHERRYQLRRFLSTHGPRAFYGPDASAPSSWFTSEEGVTT